MPKAASEFEGQPYEDVVATLLSAGFTNVEALPLADLITGWLSEEFSVDEVDAAGKTNFTADDYFDADTKITVSYHSFPEDDEGTSEEPSAPADSETLTAENNADLAALLASPADCSPEADAFGAKYSGRVIEFDANIAAMGPHGNYDTRYDILLLTGDYEPEKTSGPTFQFRDVNTVGNLHYTNESPTDTIGVGTNLHIKAKCRRMAGSAWALRAC